MADDREALGRLVHEIRLACEAERAAAEGRQRFLLSPWEERDDWQRELDMRIGAEVAAAERERIAARMDDLAAYYPESVWPPDSDVRDSIGATAMRHAYRNAAREIREGCDRDREVDMRIGSAVAAAERERAERAEAALAAIRRQCRMVDGSWMRKQVILAIAGDGEGEVR